MEPDAPTELDAPVELDAPIELDARAELAPTTPEEPEALPDSDEEGPLTWPLDVPPLDEDVALEDSSGLGWQAQRTIPMQGRTRTRSDRAMKNLVDGCALNAVWVFSIHA